ncbi:MAG: hypothetical protein P1V20_04680 [Verrucomicrobiales bacterium]|nr:hypothetical protein [Verrucomicrobiales bacterium]
MKCFSISMLCAVLFLAEAPVIAGDDGEKLPFNPVKICRLSLDGKPRSISIRQGGDVWLGYDVEKAAVFKVWQAPEGKPGLKITSFKATSAGTSLFDKKDVEGWQMTRNGKTEPLTVSYLGCTQTGDSFELSWELNPTGGKITLTERVPSTPGSNTDRAYRELRVESLKAGESLSPSPGDGNAWVVTDPAGKSVSSISGAGWYRLSLP